MQSLAGNAFERQTLVSQRMPYMCRERVCNLCEINRRQFVEQETHISSNLSSGCSARRQRGVHLWITQKKKTYCGYLDSVLSALD